MKRGRREVPVFSLSFLDVISCGFGAAILLFMLVDHARVDRDLSANDEMIARVNALESELLDGRQDLLSLRAALDDNEDATETASRDAQRLREKIEQLKAALPQAENSATTRSARLQQLQDELLALESRVQEMRAASKDSSGDANRTVAGEGRRQYLQGLQVSGSRVLILIDTSASMLGESIVDAVRRRNMSDERRRAAPKWRRSVATVDWITAQIEPTARFQLIGFSENARTLAGSSPEWVPASGAKLDAAVSALRDIAPVGGTNLAAAFAMAAAMSPPPDNLYLITDGLPTRGAKPGGATVSGRERARLFEEAAAALPRSVPVNIVLLPMEGDPRASAYFWQLAQASGGAFLEPSRDWP